MSKPSSAARTIVTCPACRRDSVYGPENPYRPFCSERCRQADFGGWATERYRVGTTRPAEDGDAADDIVTPH